MFVVIVLIILFLFVVKSSSRKDNILGPDKTGHYTRLRRYPNRDNRSQRRIKRDLNTKI